jgi:hypothetical protein
MQTPRPHRWPLPLLIAPLLLLLCACCATPPLPAAAVTADLPEVGEVWPRRTH